MVFRSPQHSGLPSNSARRTRSPWPIILIGLRVLYKERPTHNLKRQYLIVPDSSLLVRRPLWAANTTERQSRERSSEKKPPPQKTVSPHFFSGEPTRGPPLALYAQITKDLINDFSLQPIFANREKYVFKLFPSPGEIACWQPAVWMFWNWISIQTHTGTIHWSWFITLSARADFSQHKWAVNRGKQTYLLFRFIGAYAKNLKL